jgi:DNA-binding IclR family transcriptional regulator
MRAIEIIDFMSQTPSQAYTLTELVRHTGTNVASLHAILNVLMRRGYLVRHHVHKTYRLSSALAAIGEAVASNHPVLAHARTAAEGLAMRTGLEVTVTVRAGEDVVCLFRAAGHPLSRVSLRIGQRLTLRPPLGMLFYAWAEPEEVDAWIALGDHTDAGRVRAALAIVRERGFLVTVRSTAKQELARALAAKEQSRAQTERELAGALRELERTIYQPEVIAPDETYDVDIISGPIIDPAQQATYAMNLNGFSGPLTGDEIYRLAHALTEACGDVMRNCGINFTQRS